MTVTANYDEHGKPSDDHWIHGAIKRPGALHKKLGVKPGDKIPKKKLVAAEHSDNPLERKEADFASELKGFHHA